MDETSEDRALNYLKHVFNLDKSIAELPTIEEFIEKVKGTHINGATAAGVLAEQRIKFRANIEDLRAKYSQPTLVDQHFELDDNTLDTDAIKIFTDYISMDNISVYDLEANKGLSGSTGYKGYDITENNVKKIINIMKNNTLAFRTKDLSSIEDIENALMNADAITLPNINKYYQAHSSKLNKNHQAPKIEKILLTIINDVLTERSDDLRKPHTPYDDVHDNAEDKGMNRRGKHQKQMRDDSKRWHNRTGGTYDGQENDEPSWKDIIRNNDDEPYRGK